MAGFLVVKDEKIAERLEYLEMTTGAVLSPFDSWLLIRGIQTLGVRMDRACSNAALIAERLTKRKEITRVIYPGLPDHPGHEIMKKQARGFGAMISFECESAELAKNILSELRLIKFAESLGGTQSLMTYPVTQTHADVPEEQRLKNGLNDRILRLSVGIESSEDLIRDIENAIDKAAAKL
jgi:cystathionine beta-lyase/cystathionine gamma-synthase